MNGITVLSLIPIINVGTGRNFDMSIDLPTGLMGMIFSMSTRYTSWARFFYSILLGMAVALLLGHLYAKALNHLKPNEKIVGTSAGYSLIPVINLLYTSAPITNCQMLYLIGGQRPGPKASLEPYLDQVLDRLWQVRIKELVIPAGLLLFFFEMGFLLWLFSKARTGMIFSTITESERFMWLAGVNVNRYHTTTIIMSAVIAAVGTVVYSQSYGIFHLHNGPLMMSFPVVPAIVVSGANPREATVANALIGTSLHQTIYLLSIPMANALLIPETAEVVRTIIINGVILYVFIFKRGNMRNEAH